MDLTPLERAALVLLLTENWTCLPQHLGGFTRLYAEQLVTFATTQEGVVISLTGSGRHYAQDLQNDHNNG